jgi:hypothetical protein
MYYVVKIYIQHNDMTWFNDSHYFSQYKNGIAYLSKVADHLRVKMERKEIHMYHVEIVAYNG